MPRCMREPCRSPNACGAFGYCRRRNLAEGIPTRDQLARWQRQATQRYPSGGFMYAPDGTMLDEQGNRIERSK